MILAGGAGAFRIEAAAMRSVLPLCAALLLGACSSSEDQVSVGDGRADAQLRVIHDNERESGPGSALPEEYDFVRMEARDAGGRVVLASDLAPTDGEQVFSLPAATASVRFEYYTKERRPVADFEMPLTASQQTIELPGDPTAPVHVVNTFGSVRGRTESRGTTLLVNDVPTFLQGAGCDYSVGVDTPSATNTQWFSYVNPDLANAKCNAVRTYGLPWNFDTVQQQTANLSAMLAQAKASNFYVVAGLPYDVSFGNQTTVIPQTVTAVQADPNYDRLLCWCIGNEVEPSQFSGLNSVIGQVKSGMTTSALVRPVMTALPAVSTTFVSTINSSLSNIDWLGINTFYGQYGPGYLGPGGYLNTQGADLSAAGFAKPWVITEYYSYDLGSTLGIPSVTLNGQALGLELNSTQNAANYAASWQLIQSAKTQGCVGGLALNWAPPHNSQLPAYYKQMYSYRGAFTPFINPPFNVTGFDRFQCVDTVAGLYGGSVSSNPCPQIVLGADNDPQGLTCSFKGTTVAAGTSLTASVSATDTDSLTYDWYLIGGAPQGFGAGNITAPNTNPQNYGGTTSQLVQSSASNTVTFPAPAAPGNNYQLRVIVRDGQGGAATAVVPFGITP